MANSAASSGVRSALGGAPGSSSYSGWTSWSRPRKLDTVPANMPSMPGTSRLKANWDLGDRKKNVSISLARSSVTIDLAPAAGPLAGHRVQ